VSVAGGSGSRGDSPKRADTVVEHPDEPSVGEVRLHLVFGQVRQADPGQCRVQPQGAVVNTSCPSTRTFSSRPRFSNSQA